MTSVVVASINGNVIACIDIGDGEVTGAIVAASSLSE